VVGGFGYSVWGELGIGDVRLQIGDLRLQIGDLGGVGWRAAGGGWRIWVGLGLFWVCFFGVGGGLFLRKAFWDKGLGLVFGFGDWVCFA